ncbi:MAG: hypothetical protein EOP32_19445 [Rhodococcus sp. (in: high G+C Gram-positive bacteria)]|nr:MAG: hypothetical protein EOP32_19445 [Rhodococcus sp. (in: high G+C Gram-positive bacteria)]
MHEYRGETIISSDIDERIRQLLVEYDTPQACAAELLCDRHPDDKVAFTVVESDLTTTDLTYGDLRRRSAQFAAALAELGIEPGDRIATLMGKSAQLVVVLLGIWRRGAVHVPLFTAFAPPAIGFRLESSEAKIVISDANQLDKLQPGEDIPADAPWLVIAADSTENPAQLRLDDLLAGYTPDDPRGNAVAVGGQGLLVQLFTSGTTGTPKGVPVLVRALASFHAYLEFGLDARPDDVFWNAADPGWAYGLYYAILAPLASGTRSILLHAGFSAPLTWQIMLADDADEFAPTGTIGRVVIDTVNSPLLWFPGYIDAREKTAQRYTEDGRWYLTGDAGMVDADGNYFFSARDDDVIIMAGYRIGLFDVESVLVLHDDVIEAAVVGLPDELRGEVLEAFVVLRHGVVGGDELEAELQTLVKRKFAAHAYPRRVHFVPSLPKTPRGKVQRFLLGKQESARQ